MGYNREQLREIAFTEIPPLRGGMRGQETDAEYEALLNDLPELFENPLIKKRINFFGHGNTGEVETIARMSIPYLEKILRSLEPVGLDIALLDTCHGASINMVKAFYKKPYSFHILIASMGDFSTRCLSRTAFEAGYFPYIPVTSNHFEFWKRINQVMMNKIPKKNDFKSALEGVCGNNFTAIPVLIMPQTNRARALKFEKGFTVTPKFLQKGILEVVCDKSFVALYPEQINLHLILKPFNDILPLIYSRIPDNHIHFIAKVSSTDRTYEQIITESLQYRINNHFSVDNNNGLEKTNTKHFFFVNCIEDKNGITIKNVFSGYYMEECQVKIKTIFQQDDTWYLKMLDDTTVISAEHGVLEMVREALMTQPSVEALDFIGVDRMNSSYVEHLKLHFHSLVNENLLNLILNPAIVDIPNLSLKEAEGALKFVISYPEYHQLVPKLVRAHPQVKIDFALWKFAIERLDFDLMETYEARGYTLAKEPFLEDLLITSSYTKSERMMSKVMKEVTTVSLKILDLIIIHLPGYDSLIKDILSKSYVEIKRNADGTNELSYSAYLRLLHDENLSLLSLLTCPLRHCFNIRFKEYMYPFNSSQTLTNFIEIYFNSVYQEAGINNQTRLDEFIKDILDILELVNLFNKGWVTESFTSFVKGKISKLTLIGAISSGDKDEILNLCH